MRIMCGIYKITSPTNCIYIGKSIDIRDRYSAYKHLRCEDQPRLYNSLAKHGFDNHKFEVLMECDSKWLSLFEKYYIKVFDTLNTPHGLNLTAGGDGGRLSEETKKKISEKRKGIIFSEETKRKMSESAKNKPPISDETREKLKAARKRQVCTDETRAKRRAAQLGKKLSEETKKKLIGINKGRKLSEEQKKTISERNKRIGLLPPSRKGKPLSEEHKKKIGQANKGKKMSDDAREKMSKAKKGKPSNKKDTKHSEETKQKLKYAWVRRKNRLKELENKDQMSIIFEDELACNLSDC